MVILSLPAPADPEGSDRGLTISPETLAALRPHLVDLSDGRFSSAGQVGTGPEDVDRIFDSYLPAFIEAKGGKDVPVMIYAHGGLVSEAAGIAGAARQRPWWLDNGVYPLFFVWETGMWDALRSLLGGKPRDLPLERGWIEEGVSRVIEHAARPLGEKVWGQMKIGAAHATASDGGARYVAERLARFTRENPGAIKLHAVGHSAGSIFHSQFLPCFLDAGGQEVSTLSLLAPAVNTADFTERLLPRIGAGHGIGHLDLFAMTRDAEEADNVLGIYQRSLLCLVRASLERDPNTPLLGLQESVEADPAIGKLLAGEDGTAVWAPTRGAGPEASSYATSHSAFDDDPATLGSVLRRITGSTKIIEFTNRDPLGPAGIPPAPEPAPADPEPASLQDTATGDGPVDAAAALDEEPVGESTFMPGAGSPGAAASAATGGGTAQTTVTVTIPADSGAGAAPVPGAAAGGASVGVGISVGTTAGARTPGKSALCVGINEFQNLPQSSWLNGCVNDAEEFRDLLLRNYGYAESDVQLLANAEATREEVFGRLEEAMAKIRTGELGQFVFTFSSHGTQVPDTNDDEDDQADEAFVTYDMAQRGDQWDPGTLIVDDELHAMFDELPATALVDVVLDTCHSGSGLRAFDLLPGRRPRFVPPPTPAGLDAAAEATRRGIHDFFRGTRAERRPVLFAACRPDQTAADAHINGQYNGAFTRYLIDGLRTGNGHSRADLLKTVRADLRQGRFAQVAQLEGQAAAKRTGWGQGY